jgi:hypothetical protein
MINMARRIKWCVIYGRHDIRDFKSEQEALKAYPVLKNYKRTEYEESVVYRHPEWEPLVMNETIKPGTL